MQRLIESINSMLEFMWNNIFTVPKLFDKFFHTFEDHIMNHGMSLKKIFEEIKAEKS